MSALRTPDMDPGFLEDWQRGVDPASLQELGHPMPEDAPDTPYIEEEGHPEESPEGEVAPTPIGGSTAEDEEGLQKRAEKIIKQHPDVGRVDKRSELTDDEYRLVQLGGAGTNATVARIQNGRRIA